MGVCKNICFDLRSIPDTTWVTKNQRLNSPESEGQNITDLKNSDKIIPYDTLLYS